MYCTNCGTALADNSQLYSTSQGLIKVCPGCGMEIPVNSTNSRPQIDFSKNTVAANNQFNPNLNQYNNMNSNSQYMSKPQYMSNPQYMYNNVAYRQGSCGGWIAGSIICALVALFFFPPFVGGFGIFCGSRVYKAGKHGGGTALIVANAISLIIGMIIGVITRLYMHNYLA